MEAARPDIRGRHGPRDDIPDHVEEPEVWCRRAVQACLDVWSRVGVRYTRRVDDADRVRDVEDDVLALAARRVVPLAPARPLVPFLVRPLPGETLETLALHFNRLDPADRFVLRRLDRLSPQRGPRSEHLASALERLSSALSASTGELPLLRPPSDLGDHGAQASGGAQGKRPPPVAGDGL